MHGTEALEQAPGGVVGVNLPGDGCYVNGWLFAYERAGNARAALRDPAIYPRIVATVAHEKLGHGFLAEYSAMGQEKTRLGLWRYDHARRFGTAGPDTPRSRLLAAKHSILYHSSTFAEEGWSNWIEQYIAGQFASATNDQSGAGHRSPSTYPTLEHVRVALTEIALEDEELTESAETVLISIDTLFPSASGVLHISDVHTATIALQTHADALADAVSAKLGQPLPYVLGHLLADQIADTCGDLCVPYAILIAANVTYDLEQISVVDLAHLTTDEARLNINSRLAHMTFLRPTRKNDVAEMATLAREHLNFSTPANLKLDA